MKKSTTPSKEKAPEVIKQPASGLEKIVFSVYLLLGGVAAFLGAQLIGPSIVGFLALSFGVKSNKLVSTLEDNNFVRFILILVVEILTVLGVRLLLKWKKWQWKDIGLGRKPERKDIWRGLKAYGVYFVIFMGVYGLVQLSGLVDTEQAQQLGFENTHGLQLILVFLSLVILPPIAEEVIFRGYIFLGLRKKLSFIWAACITSLLFSAAHLEFGSGYSLNWAAAIDTLTLSLVLTYFTEKSRSIWPSMVAHASKNFVAFLLLFVIK